MQIQIIDPPRVFRAGSPESVTVSDCGRLRLSPDEQVTFVTASGRQYDLLAKPWGFYATPSVNGRLRAQGFKTALVRGPDGKVYVMVVEREQLHMFEHYLEQQQHELLEWLEQRGDVRDE